MVKKKRITKSLIKNWLNSKLTDMSTYDPKNDMEDGEHIFGALSRKAEIEDDNAIILEIKKRLSL